MRMFAVAAAGIALVLVGQPSTVELPTGTPDTLLQVQSRVAELPTATPTRAEPSTEDLTGVVQRYCQICHNDQLLTGNMSLQGFDVAKAADQPELSEKVIQKLRARMMPPPGALRPAGDTLLDLVETLEGILDRSARKNPNPGSRTFQRLNRVEYENSIRDLLGLEIDASAYLPPDTKSANFDNIADVQTLSPTLMDAYLRAATSVSRLAVGYLRTTPSETQFLIPQWVSQDKRVDGAPFGTRGGISVVHNLLADAEYTFRISLHYEDVGSIYGSGQADLTTVDRPEQVEISIDGTRVAMIDVDRFMHMEDPDGVTRKTDPVFVRSGPHRVTAAFIKRYEGPVADLISPFEWSIPNTATSTNYGLQQLPHLREFVIAGPFNPTGVSDSPVRRGIFTCRPVSPSEAPSCARSILNRLAAEAFRRPVTEDETANLMAFYDLGFA